MLCEICGENEATFHYSEVVNGNKTEHHLCSECAAKTDISYYSSIFDNDGRLGQLLSGLLGTTFFGEQEDPKTHIICPGCKLSYGEFIRNSAFGCAECYNVFGPLLDDSIRKIQGSTVHQGKKPYHLMKLAKNRIPDDEDTRSVNNDQSNNTKADLEHEADLMGKRLKQAIAEEDYEEAARLRDYIKDLKCRIERFEQDA